ncbi:hypothetical protein AAF712_003319 [Marasmius tenuissimus]|uniref:F-box domain-containing protein n=1 Tax=Marasmius tenuissimus TaxID=585030 RepID=A0ABR3A8K5_9AGAR
MQVLYESQEEVKGYDAEINKLKATLLALTNKRDGLEARIVAAQSLLSPIHRLPSEMLANIFAQCQDPDDALSPSTTPDIFTCSMVSGRWREVALTTPSLWTNLRIELVTWLVSHGRSSILSPGGLTRLNLERLNRTVQLYISRSAKCPLNLHLESGLGSLSEGHPQIRQLLEILTPTSDRWGSVSLWLQPTLFEDPIFHPVRKQLSSLKHLTLHPSDRLENEKCLDLFRHCPSLNSLRLHSVGDRIDPSRLLAPWSQLTRLHLYWCTFSQVAPILKLCTELEDLSLSFVWSDPPLESFAPILCPRIKSLSVEAFTRDNPLSVLLCLTLPSLSRLDVQYEIAAYNPHDFSFTPMNFMSSFIARSACVITEIHIRPSLLATDHELIRFLSRLPGLKALTMVENQYGVWAEDSEMDPDDEDVATLHSATIVTTAFLNNLRVFHRASTKKCVLPRLAHLSLSVFGAELDQEALVAAITSRWLPEPAYAAEVGVDCLRSLSVRLMARDTTPIDTLQSLYFLRDAGLRVDVYRD